MKFSYVKHKNIDQKKWDEAIRDSSAPKIYALSWYLNITSPNWDALILNDYEAVFPLPVKKKLGMVTYVQVPNFTQQLGLFAKNIDDQLLKSAINAIPKTLVKKDLLLNSSNPNVENAKSCTNYILDLNLSVTELRKKYSSQIKRNLKTANKENLIVQKDVDFKEIIDLFKSTKGAEITPIDYSILAKLCKKAEQENALHIFGAFSSKKLESGAILFEYQNRIYLIMLANSLESRKNGAASLLIDFIIEQFSDKSYILDFEGSNIPSLARFYKGFGSKNESYQLYSTYF